MAKSNKKPKDIIQHYLVSPQEEIRENPINMDLLIASIISYTQNNEIYFKYDPFIKEGVLVFAIVGFKKDHQKLQEVLGEQLNLLNCKITVAKI